MENEQNKQQRKFLGIMFDCCGVYGRIYPNKDNTAYVGRCPRCLRTIKVPIGETGTGRRFFRGQ